MTVLMRLFSSANTLFRGKAYADEKRTREIDQPCLVLHITTVPDNLFQALTLESLVDGFASRLFVLQGDDAARRQKFSATDIPTSIIEAVREWGMWEPGGGNLSKEHPEPRVVPYSPGASRVFEELADEVDQAVASGSPAARALWSRANEKARRLALVYAASRGPHDLIVDEAAATWACDLARYATDLMLFKVTDWIAESPFEARQKKILRAMREEGGVLTKARLYSLTRSLSVREREDHIKNLVVTGQIIERCEATSGRPRTLFLLPSRDCVKGKEGKCRE